MFVDIKITVMKRKFAFIGLTLTFIGFTAIGLVAQQSQDQTKGEKQETKQLTSHSLSTLTQFPSTNFLPNNDLQFTLKGKYSHTTSLEQLKTAKEIIDFYPDYPGNWISDYVSVDLFLIQNGETIQTTSATPTLTNEQRAMLNKAELFSDVIVEVKYNTTNSITNEVTLEVHKNTFTSVPEMQAKFDGGQEKLNVFFKANAAPELMDYLMKKNQVMLRNEQNLGDYSLAKVELTIAKDGSVKDVAIIQSCGDNSMDALLKQLIEKTPNWTPAQTKSGETIEQTFELSIGRMGC
jgi:hypothetical protein